MVLASFLAIDLWVLGVEIASKWLVFWVFFAFLKKYLSPFGEGKREDGMKICHMENKGFVASFSASAHPIRCISPYELRCKARMEAGVFLSLLVPPYSDLPMCLPCNANYS